MKWGAGEKDEVQTDRDLKKKATRAALHARTRAFNHMKLFHDGNTLPLPRENPGFGTSRRGSLLAAASSPQSLFFQRNPVVAQMCKDTVDVF